MSRYACLYVPDLPLAAALRAEPELRSKPLAIIDVLPAGARGPRASAPRRRTSSPVIVAGWLRGLTVAQAETVRTDLVVRPLSAEGVISAQEALFDVGHSVTPRVQETAPGELHLDLEGTEALFPTLRGLLLAFDKRLKEVGLDTARAGIGPSRTVAALAARHRGGWSLVQTNEFHAFLDPLPLDLLEPPDDVFDRLGRWGVRTLGDLRRLPLDALGARLGEAGARLARRARGEDLSPFEPSAPRMRFEEAAESDFAIDNLETLGFLLRGALERLARRLRLRALAVRELRLELVLTSGETWGRDVGLGAPTLETQTLLTLVRLALERDAPQQAVERLRVIASPGALEPAQLDLFLPPLPAPAELAVTVARLEALCGNGRVGAPALDDTHRLDAARVEAFPEQPQAKPGAVKLPRPTLAFRAVRPPRPIRAFVCDGLPERVELDGDRWNVLHRAGPWRLFGEWWGETRFARDYFDVEIDEGGVYRIYQNLIDESWYLDGEYD